MTQYRTGVVASDFHPLTRDYFAGRRVVVTGGAGFIGSHVVEQLLLLSATPIVPIRRDVNALIDHLGDEIERRPCDLAQLEQVGPMLDGASVVMNLAAHVGGVAYNNDRPATLFDLNMHPFLNVMREAIHSKVERFLVTSSACVYRRDCPVPTPENDVNEGVPEKTNLGYGWSKRMQEFLGAAYAEQFGLEVAIARPYNAYGPRDDFRPDRSHVIPALILKAFRSTTGSFTVWGDGGATRSFLYVDDFARALIEITARHPRADPLNIDGPGPVSISDLAALIGELVSDNRKFSVGPKISEQGLVGQPARSGDTTKLRNALTYATNVSLEHGLRKTVKWFSGHEDHAFRIDALRSFLP